MLPTDHPQDDLLIADALLRHSYRLEGDAPQRARRAHDLATAIVERHGLSIPEAHRQIDRNYPRGHQS